jgi:ankyrin repeat protein
MDALGESGFSLHIADRRGRTPFRHAADCGQHALLKHLCALGRFGEVDWNTKDEHGRTPIMYAAWRGHQETVSLLAPMALVDAEHVDNYQRSALSYAAMGGKAKTVKLLLDSYKGSIDVNQRDSFGQTPLMYAAWLGHVNIAQLLLETEGIDPNIRCRKGRSALVYAAWRGNVGAVVLLADREDVDPYGSDLDEALDILLDIDNYDTSTLYQLLSWYQQQRLSRSLEKGLKRPGVKIESEQQTIGQLWFDER